MARQPKPEGYVEYPKWLYHKRHGGRIFQSAEETRWLWLWGWQERPIPVPSGEQQNSVRLWWERWEWAFKALAVILGLIAAVIAVFKVM